MHLLAVFCIKFYKYKCKFYSNFTEHSHKLIASYQLHTTNNKRHSAYIYDPYDTSHCHYDTLIANMVMNSMSTFTTRTNMLCPMALAIVWYVASELFVS